MGPWTNIESPTVERTPTVPFPGAARAGLGATNRTGTTPLYGPWAVTAAAALLSTLVLPADPCAAQPFAYISNTSGNTVSVLDTATDSIVDTISVPAPFGMSMAVGDPLVYLLSACIDEDCTGGVQVLDSQTNVIVDTVAAGTLSVSVAVNPALPRVYVVNNGTNDVSVIDTTTNSVIATIPVWFWPSAVAVHPDGTRAYVTSQGAYIAHLTVIDSATNLVHTREINGQAFGVAVHPSGRWIYVTNGCEATCPSQPDGCDPPPCPYRGAVEVIDAATELTVANIEVERWPRGIVINPAGTRAYVANWGNNEGSSVSVINLANNTVIGSIPTGPGPWTLGVSPDGGKLYVVNNGDHTLSVIELTGEFRSGSRRDATIELDGPTQARGSIMGVAEVPPGCGDSIQVPPEACDDGNAASGDGCDSDCTLSSCGNGIVAGSEECDDGNVEDGDDCSSACELTGCGDGAVTIGETCDDGNVFACDSCDADCSPRSPCACGDGSVDTLLGEVCDDGNAATGDGCNSVCRFEMIPGGGREADCFAEWVIVNPDAVPLYDRNGRHGTKQTCTDGNAACDADGTADGDCEFRVTVCTAVTDTELGCSDPGLQLAEVSQPSERDALESSEAAAIRTQLGVLQTLITEGPDACSEEMPMRVALRSGTAGSRPGKLRIRTEVGVTGTVDKDSLTLTCRPAL